MIKKQGWNFPSMTLYHVYPMFFPSIRPSIHPTIHALIHPSILPSANLSFILLAIHLHNIHPPLL